MADEDWGLDAELQEKCLVKDKDSEAVGEPIPPPIPPEKPANSAEPSSEKDEEPELHAAEISLLNKLVRTHLVEVKHDVDIQRNPDSPLYSVKSFEELNLRPELLKGVFAMGYNSPSKIQETALPTLIADPPQNMIAQSQSGTGKTAAFILASLSRVDTNLKYPHILVLSPTYELALQVGTVAKQMAKFCPSIEFCFAVRGEHLSRGSQIQAQFIIGTPGKVFDWAMKFKFFNLKKIKVFVLDEADVMISTQGYHDQSLRIHKQLPKICQMMLFSATSSDDVMQFAEQIVPDPIIIKLKREEESLDTISQYYIECRNRDEKFEALSNIYGSISIGQAIIFCDTKKNASYLVEKMAKVGHAVALLSGDLTVEQRIAVLKRFREGKEKNPSLASIKSLPEGYIGKLQTLKSGKTRLLIGPVEYALDSVCSLRSAKHELVSVNTNSTTGLFARALECIDVKQLITNVRPGVGTAPTASVGDSGAAKEEKKEEKKEESHMS